MHFYGWVGGARVPTISSSDPDVQGHSDEPLRAGSVFINGFHASCVSSPLHSTGSELDIVGALASTVLVKMQQKAPFNLKPNSDLYTFIGDLCY